MISVKRREKKNMGGSGSGNWYRGSKKDTTDDYCNLYINYLVKHGYLKEGIYNGGGSLTWSVTRMGEKHTRSSISFKVNTLEGEGSYFQPIYTNSKTKEKFDYKIPITSTNPNYGGKRWWFICPLKGCSRRVGKLYLTGTYFGCRKCLNLSYESQNEAPHYRMLHKAQAIHQKLGGSGCTYDWIKKPKYMHQKTYKRLINEMEHYDQLSIKSMADKLGGFDNW
jgi:hypothetical protein